MKKIVFYLFLFFLLSAGVKRGTSQTLFFCEGVSEAGLPIGQSYVFNIPKTGGFFYFLVRMPEKQSCTSVSYEIFKKDDYGKESFSSSIAQDDINPAWTYFWKKVTFYDAGKYIVYVIDCKSKTIASATVTIKYK